MRLAPRITVRTADGAIERLNWLRCALLEAGEAALKLDANRAAKAAELLVEIRERLPKFLKLAPLKPRDGAALGTCDLWVSLEIGEPLLELLLALRSLDGRFLLPCAPWARGLPPTVLIRRQGFLF